MSSPEVDPATLSKYDWTNIPFPRPILIQTPRLYLREYHIKDAVEVQKLCNNWNIVRNQSNRWAWPYDMKATVEWIDRFHPDAAKTPETQRLTAFAICLSPEGHPVGGVGLDVRNDVSARTAELGYWVGEPHWRKGYASESAWHTICWGFNQPKGIGGKTVPEDQDQPLLRIDGSFFGGNDGSEAVMKSLGLVYEGTRVRAIYKRGEIRDFVLYGITRERWEEVKEEKNKRYGTSKE